MLGLTFECLNISRRVHNVIIFALFVLRGHNLSKYTKFSHQYYTVIISARLGASTSKHQNEIMLTKCVRGVEQMLHVNQGYYRKFHVQIYIYARVLGKCFRKKLLARHYRIISKTKSHSALQKKKHLKARQDSLILGGLAKRNSNRQRLNISANLIT